MRPILIAGPTASGKSALALALAERFDGVVINTDSMQVYRELRVLTARPADEDLQRAPHLLYGFVVAREAYSAGRFAGDVSAALLDASNSGRRPILVGGTGLYFKTLLEGLSPIPQTDAEVRAHWRHEADVRGPQALHAILSQRDPAMAAVLKPGDGQRIVRALEVYDSTGRSLSEWQSVPGDPIIAAKDAVLLVVMPGREELRARADARFDRMLAEGGLDEVAALAEQDLDPTLPAMRAIGIAPLMGALAGRMSMDEAVRQSKAETRQYIKRQSTWINGHMIAWKRLNTQSLQSSMASAIAFIQS